MKLWADFIYVFYFFTLILLSSYDSLEDKAIKKVDID